TRWPRDWSSDVCSSDLAAGTPEELAQARGVEIETEDGKRVYEDARRQDAPRLVAELVAAGRKIYGVSVRTSTLEEVYLDAVGGRSEERRGGKEWWRRRV